MNTIHVLYKQLSLRIEGRKNLALMICSPCCRLEHRTQKAQAVKPGLFTDSFNAANKTIKGTQSGSLLSGFSAAFKSFLGALDAATISR
jgi:hypothetical protein